MAHVIRVERPVEFDPSIVALVLGEEALPVNVSDRVLAPFITIDGRIHAPSSDFLRHHCLSSPNLDTARRIASDLKGWLDYLCNTCGLPPREDARDPVLMAKEDHFAAYYRKRQYGTAQERLTPGAWGHASSSIKQFYEFIQRRYQHRPPFQIVAFSHRGGGSGTRIAKYQPRRRSTGSAGLPLTPEFAELLLMGALRIDLDGKQDSYRGADRDHAILSLGLASGLRRNNLANLTTFELPYTSELPITTMRVADQITKGGAGGDALVFSHRLPAVHDYVNGARAEIASRNRHSPGNPAHVVDADSQSVRYYTNEEPNPVVQTWMDADADLRRRLVLPDGTSPLLFLNEYTGGPLAYSSLAHAIAGARDFTRRRINPKFPVGFRIHDLRHTYAVHLTVAIFRDVVADAVAHGRRGDWTVDRIAEAVELVKYSLGHASEHSTRLYVQTTHRFLNIPVEQFLGRF